MANFITSRNNENIKYITKLLNSSKFRKENHQFVIEGLRLCYDALRSNVNIQKVFYTEEIYNKFTDLMNKIIKFANSVFVVNEKIMKIISDTDCPQGIVCVCEFIDHDLHLDANKNRIVILDNIQNPSNLGAIIRTCDALGFDGVVISKDSCDIYNPKTLRASMGSIFRTKVLLAEDIKDVVIYLKKNGVYAVAMAAENDSIDIRSMNNLDNIALVIGNEGNGIREEIKEVCSCKGKIPINSDVDSLNAAVAAGIAMWEVTR